MKDDLQELDKVLRETPPDIDPEEDDRLHDQLEKMENDLPERYKKLL